MPSIRVSQDVYDRLIDYAKKENRSVANAANHIMEQTLIGYDDIGKVGTNPQTHYIVIGDKVPIDLKDERELGE